jgi:hypothetical protein
MGPGSGGPQFVPWLTTGYRRLFIIIFCRGTPHAFSKPIPLGASLGRAKSNYSSSRFCDIEVNCVHTHVPCTSGRISHPKLHLKVSFHGVYKCRQMLWRAQWTSAGRGHTIPGLDSFHSYVGIMMNVSSAPIADTC